MIEFHQVGKHYASGKDALRNVDLRVGAGELVFLTGHSGAGKSTLLRLIALLENVSSGQILVDGKNIGRFKRSQIPHYRRHIGMVEQTPRLLSNHSVFDNVALPLVVTGTPHSEVTKRVRGALDQVGLLDKDTQHALTLSAGEQQRVGIARAVVNRPLILLADEPTGNLDPMLSKEIMGLFERFKQLGTTVIVVTHDLGLLRSFRHRIYSLRNGSFDHHDT